ncbi:MAG: hypothetical protein R3C60_15010 [Parvularculaceae bacterium]
MKSLHLIAAASAAFAISGGAAFAAPSNASVQSARDGTHMALERPAKGQASIVYNGEKKQAAWSPRDSIFNGRKLDIHSGVPKSSAGSSTPA